MTTPTLGHHRTSQGQLPSPTRPDLPSTELGTSWRARNHFVLTAHNTREPSGELYVGDTVHADVRGATSAGMPMVQLDPYDLHADFDHARLPDIGALADLLLAAP